MLENAPATPGSSARSTDPEDNDDERQEKVVIGGAVALALLIALGFVAQKQGMLDRFFGDDVVKLAAPIVGFVHHEAEGDPARVLMSGFVGSEGEGRAIEAALHRAFPKSEIKNAVRIDAPRPAGKGGKPAADKKSTVRISFAADAVNEAWGRPRFGDVKRLELVAKDGKITVRGAVFTPEARARLEQAFASLGKDKQGVLQLRDVQRPVVPAAQLQQDLSVAVAGRSVAFDAVGGVDAVDPASASVLSSVAPLVKNLSGLEVWISAGADDRALALKQAEALKSALVAQGADAAGLRPVSAPKNTTLSLIVREKE